MHVPQKSDFSKDESALQARLGSTVKTCRKQLGITQEELAWRANMHRTYLADIERGVRNVTLRSIANLARALQLSIESLLAHGRSAHDNLGEVLLVEDSAADIELTLRALKRAKLANPIRTVRDGAEAIEYLFAEGRQAPRKNFLLPQLILLDLNLPKVSGLEVLRRIKANSATRGIPVIILTVSRQDRLILECSRLGVANYIVKPVNFDNFSKLIPKVSLRWAVLRSLGTEPHAGGG